MKSEEEKSFSHRFKWHIIIIGTIAFLSNGITVSALDYSDFPDNLQWILDDRIEELDSKGGFCIAGRVTFNDGAQIYDCGDVEVNFADKLDEPIPVYYDGWFIARRVLDAKYGGSNKRVVLRSFYYDPIDAYVTTDEGCITYLELEMTKTSKEELCEIKGTVFDENGNPLEGATVSLYFPRCHFPESELRMVTGPDGQYSFDSVTKTNYRVKASAPGYADCQASCRPSADSTAVVGLALYPHRRIYLKYVYQPDGSRDFTSGDLVTKALDWKHDNIIGKGMLFSDGVITKYANDLVLLQERDVLYFSKYYGSSEYTNGFYDEGLVDFNSIRTAAEDPSKYRGYRVPSQVGHVYVVKTLQGPCYTKFIVLTDEYSFRTVNPANLKSYHFRGHDLDVGITSCSGSGKVYVRKFYDAPDGLDISYLPYYWEISGLEGLVFKADLALTYNEQDILRLNLPEESLVIYQYDDSTDTWKKVSSRRDSKRNILFAESISTWGLFAIGSD